MRNLEDSLGADLEQPGDAESASPERTTLVDIGMISKMLELSLRESVPAEDLVVREILAGSSSAIFLSEYFIDSDFEIFPIMVFLWAAFPKIFRITMEPRPLLSPSHRAMN